MLNQNSLLNDCKIMKKKDCLLMKQSLILKYNIIRHVFLRDMKSGQAVQTQHKECQVLNQFL